MYKFLLIQYKLGRLTKKQFEALTNNLVAEGA